ncbi:MAG: universal stress protein [Pseudomonadota bacterium]
MYKHVMVPIDLRATEALEKALTAAGQIAKLTGAEVTYVGIAGGAPSSTAHNPAEFREKLEAFAEEQAGTFGITARSHAVISHDPEVEIGSSLVEAAEKMGVDLVVMASHIPGWVEHIFHSNAGYVACHAKCSVFVVR